MENLEAMIEETKTLKFLFKAQVSYPNKDLAKQAGFQWNPERKEWTRRMLEADTKDLPFSVVKVPSSL